MKRRKDQEQSKKVSTEAFLSKINETHEQMKKLLEVDKDGESQLNRDKQIATIETALKECVKEGDFNKALAIFDYVSCLQSVSLNELNLKNLEDENSVAHVALDRNFVEEFIDLILVGESMKYLSETAE